MKTEYLVLHYGSEREVIKEIGEQLPHSPAAILSHTLVVKPIHLGDLPALVIPSQQMNAVRKTCLQAQEQADRLNGIVSAIHIVSHEQVVRVRGLPSDTKELKQIVQLAMYIAANRHRAVHRLYIRLLHQRLLRLIAQQPYLCLRQWLALIQLFHPSVKIHCREIFELKFYKLAADHSAGLTDLALARFDQLQFDRAVST